MRRVPIVVAASLLGVLSLAGPATAAPGQVVQFRYHGTFAEADWVVTSGNTFADTYLNVSKAKTGMTTLFLQKFVTQIDDEGTFLGATQTTVDVTSGFTLSIDGVKLSTASVHGSGLPAQVCELDSEGNTIEPCGSATVSVDASWTGEGPTSRSVSNSRFSTEGFRINDHFNGTSRNAVASGTVAGSTLTANDLEFAFLGTTNSGQTKFCNGCTEGLSARRS